MAEAPKVVGALANEQPQGGYSLSRAEEDMPVYIPEYALGQNVCDSLEGVTTRTGGVLGVACVEEQRCFFFFFCLTRIVIAQ